MAFDFDSKRWSVMSWLSPLAAFGMMAFLFTSSIGQGRPAARISPQFTCRLSSFFSFDTNEQVGNIVHMEGRGLATCRNDQGVTTEIPVYGDLEARLSSPITNASEISFSGNSATFVVPQDFGQLQDRYVVNRGSTSSVSLRGVQHNVIIEMNFENVTQALQENFRKIDVRAVTLHFDESAPTFD